MKAAVESWRLFVAIELPVKLRQRLTAHTGRLRHLAPDVRASWVREDNLHLTVKFLGDVPLAKVETMSRIVQDAARMFKPFELNVGECGAFPTSSKPRVLWIGVEDSSGSLGLLHQVVEDECEKAGLASEQRLFHPHLTIARLREAQRSGSLGSVHQNLGFEIESVLVSDLALIRSELRSGGSRHTVVARHSLASSAA